MKRPPCFRNTPSSRTLHHLKTLQQKVDEVVSVAKTRWSFHLAEEIHNMTFNPKEAWVIIGRLTGGESSHHTSPKVIQVRLPSGNLAENDEENVSVFANNFKKVLNNHNTTPLRPETPSCMLSEPNKTLRHQVHFITSKHSNRRSTKQ